MQDSPFLQANVLLFSASEPGFHLQLEKAFLCTLLTEEFTCVSFWYLHVKASYFREL